MAWPGHLLADSCQSSWSVQESASPGTAGQPNRTGRSERQRQCTSRRNHACVIGRETTRSRKAALGDRSPTVTATRLPCCCYGAGHGVARSLGSRTLGATRHPRQSTLALTVAGGQYAAVARPTRLSVAPDEARHSLLTNDPHRGRCGVRREALRYIPGVAGMDWRDVLGSDVLPGAERLREKEHDRKLAAGSRYQGRCARGPARYGES